MYLLIVVWLQIYASCAAVLQAYLSLIPEQYLTGKALTSTIQEPCSVTSDESDICAKYAYLNLPRQGVYTIELEGAERSNSALFDRSKYPSLNINGAILLRYEQVTVAIWCLMWMMFVMLNLASQCAIFILRINKSRVCICMFLFCFLS